MVGYQVLVYTKDYLTQKLRFRKVTLRILLGQNFSKTSQKDVTITGQREHAKVISELQQHDIDNVLHFHTFTTQ